MSSLYIQREAKRSTGEVFLVHPKRIEELTGEVFFVQPKRIEEAYRRGLLFTAKENQRGVQERPLYFQRELKRSTGVVIFVQS